MEQYTSEPPTSETKTREQVLETILALKPIDAQGKTNGNQLALVRTEIYDSVIVDGKTIQLHRDELGRYAMGNVRVSVGKKDGEKGYSDQEQAEAIVDKCIELRQSFSVVSDVGISGGLPYNDPRLIRKFRTTKAKMYEEVFRAVFFRISSGTPETPENVKGMEDYLAKELNKIKNGGYANLFTFQPGEKAPSGRARKEKWFRPGLTALVQAMGEDAREDEEQEPGAIHTVYITDLTRLSRSELLMADLMPKFRARNIKVVGIYQETDYLNKKDLSAKVMELFFTHMAEKTRYDILVGIMRGIKQKCTLGVHNSKAPDWIVRKGDEKGKVKDATGKSSNKNEKAVLDEPQAAIARLIVEVYLSTIDGVEASVTDVVNTLDARGLKNRYGKRFTLQQVGKILDNPALVGRQRYFGKEWDVFPRLIDDAEWKQIQEKRAARRENHKRRYAPISPKDHLMVGLIQCYCGYSMVAEGPGNGHTYYACRNPVSSKGHARLPHPIVDEFFDYLMRNHAAEIVETVIENSSGKALMAEIQELRETSLRNASIRATKAKKVEKELIPKVAATYPQDDPVFITQLAAALAFHTRDLTEEADKEAEEIKQREDKLKELRSEGDLAAIKTVVKSWPELSVPKRNQILKDLFECFRVEGTAPNEKLVPVLKVAQTFDMLPITIHGKKHGRSYIRWLQDPEEWQEEQERHQEGFLDPDEYEEIITSATIEPLKPGEEF